MTELVNRTRISEIVHALGGPEVKRDRCAAWYRDGKSSTSVSLDDARGVWRDHGSGKGGGVLALIETALGCSRREAVAWLADHHGVSIDGGDPREARRLAEQRRQAREQARELVRWRDDLAAALIALRNQAWDAARELDWATTGADPNDPDVWELVAEAVRRRRAGDVLCAYAALLRPSPKEKRRGLGMRAAELVELRRALEPELLRRAA